MKNGLFGLGLIIFLLLGIEHAKAEPYFLMTAEDGHPLFTREHEYQEILDTKLADRIHPEVTVSHHSLGIDEGVSVNFSWYQSGKPELIVLAVGKGGLLKDKLPFIYEFTQHYDVIIFDYEWQNPAPLYRRAARIATPLERYFIHNHQEVQAIVSHVRQLNTYESIIGHAECYSVFMFAKAQALRPIGSRLFDKLIFDSGILSVKNTIKSFFKNPALCCNPLDGQSYPLTKALMGNKLFLALIDLCVRDYSAKDYFAAIDIPVLFVRGINDTMVSQEDFVTMWNVVDSEKAAFLTPYHHSDSFKRKNARREYLYVENLFIQNSYNDFIRRLS